MTPLYNTDQALWENYRTNYPTKFLVLHDNGGVTNANECLAFFNDQDHAKKVFTDAGYRIKKAPKDFGERALFALATDFPRKSGE